MIGAIATSREAKGGRPYGRKDVKNGLMARGCRGQQGPGEKAEGGKTASSGRAVEAGRMEYCLTRKSKTGAREENWVQIAVQLSLGVADGRGSQYTEDEGGGSRKSQTMGQGLR